MGGEIETVSRTKMNRGAVAVIDALGWKGIWSKHPADLLIGQMKGFRDSLTKRAEQGGEIVGRFGKGRLTHELIVQTRFLSDTIVLAVGLPDYSPVKYDDGREILDGTFAWFAGLSTSVALAAAAHGAPPLNYRAAISVGEFVIDETFLLGPAIDEAAGLHEEPDAAIVMYAPSAIGPVKRMLAAPRPEARMNVDAGSVALEYEIPLHGGKTLTTLAISPFAICRDWGQTADVLRGVTEAFGSDPRIERKSTATLAFLDLAHKHWLTFRK